VSGFWSTWISHELGAVSCAYMRGMSRDLCCQPRGRDASTWNNKGNSKEWTWRQACTPHACHGTADERERRRPRALKNKTSETSLVLLLVEQGVMVGGVRHGGVVGKIGPCRTKCSAALKVGKATGCGRSCYARPRRCSARAAARVLEDSRQVRRMRHDVQRYKGQGAT
jgi:hypothetical protein